MAARLLAVVVAVTATTLVALLARAAGLDLEVSGGERIPVSGVAFVTAVASLVGVALAVALQRWSAHPTRLFLTGTLALTTLSLLPPFLAAAGLATALTLVALHLVAAAVVIPALARTLRPS